MPRELKVGHIYTALHKQAGYRKWIVLGETILVSDHIRILVLEVDEDPNLTPYEAFLYKYYLLNGELYVSDHNLTDLEKIIYNVSE